MAKMMSLFSVVAVLAFATMTSGCIPSCCKKECPKAEMVEENADADTVAKIETEAVLPEDSVAVADAESVVAEAEKAA